MLYHNRTTVADAAHFLSLMVVTLDPTTISTPKHLADFYKDWKICAKAGHFYSPTFTYDDKELRFIALLGHKIREYWEQIYYNCIPQNEIDYAILSVLEGRVNHAIAATDIADNIYIKNSARTQESILSIYGKPSLDLIARCHDAIDHPTAYTEGYSPRFSDHRLNPIAGMSHNTTSIRKYFDETLEYYGFSQMWECVVLPHMAHQVEVFDQTEKGKSRLVIAAGTDVGGLKLASLISREIEGRIRGIENSRALFRQLISDESPLFPLVNMFAKSYNELLSNGTAALSDMISDGNSALPHPYYVIAINNALLGDDFGKIANSIYMLRFNGFTTKDAAVDFAWNIACDVFRGSTDPREGGYAFTKSFDHLAGYLMTKNVPASYRDYSSMTVPDLLLLERAGVDLSSPKYPYRDYVGSIFEA